MTAAREISDRHGRHAMTLVEVLLTLCLLVLLASITWPALDRPLANQRLRKAADAVRVAWSRARVKAMSSGETQVFRYTLDSDQYVIEGRAGPEFVADTTDDGSSTATLDETSSTAAAGDGSQSAALLESTQRTLPEGVTFLAGETVYDARAEVLAIDNEPLPSTDAGQSDPILFYPDGTTSTATVQLKNEHDRTIEISLRGLTGATTVAPVQSSEEYVP